MALRPASTVAAAASETGHFAYNERGEVSGRISIKFRFSIRSCMSQPLAAMGRGQKKSPEIALGAPGSVIRFDCYALTRPPEPPRGQLNQPKYLKALLLGIDTVGISSLSRLQHAPPEVNGCRV